MERKLIDYLPHVVRDYAEYQGLTAGEQPEFERAWDRADELLDNQFVLTAGNLGLSRWEEILGIVSQTEEGIEARRARVLAQLNIHLPYTMSWLRQWLDYLCGPQSHEIDLADYQLLIRLDYDTLPGADRLAAKIFEMLTLALPANLLARVEAASYQLAPAFVAVIPLGEEIQQDCWAKIYTKDRRI